jgi:hypothetical protein
MPTLPQDIIDELVDVVSRDCDPEYLLTLGLVSKAFAVPVQAHLFRSIKIKNKDHFQRLLAVLRHNPDLIYPIRKLTIHQMEPYKPKTHYADSKNHWIHSSDGGELLDMFTNVRALTLYGLMSRQTDLDHLLTHSLRSRLQAVTKLRLKRSIHKLDLNSLARLMLHFPALETFSNFFHAQVNVNGDHTDLAPPDGWMYYTDSEGCTSNSSGMRTDDGRHDTCHSARLRRLTMDITGRTGSHFPPWFVNWKYLSRIEDLHLYTGISRVSMYSTWDLVRNTASTLRTLILNIHQGYSGHKYGENSRMHRDVEPLKAPHLRSIEIEHRPNPESLFLITDILSAIASSECTPLQTIRLNDFAVSFSDPGACEMHFWHKLDEVTARWNDTLERLVIDVRFELDWSRSQEPAEENNKINPFSEEGIRRRMVNANGRGILDLNVDVIHDASRMRTGDIF